MRAGQGSSTHELGAIQVLEFYRRLVLHPRRGPGAPGPATATNNLLRLRVLKHVVMSSVPCR